MSPEDTDASHLKSFQVETLKQYQTLLFFWWYLKICSIQNIKTKCSKVRVVLFIHLFFYPKSDCGLIPGGLLFLCSLSWLSSPFYYYQNTSSSKSIFSYGRSKITSNNWRVLLYLWSIKGGKGEDALKKTERGKPWFSVWPALRKTYLALQSAYRGFFLSLFEAQCQPHTELGTAGKYTDTDSPAAEENGIMRTGEGLWRSFSSKALQCLW